jgi:hypothetical protein
LKYCESGIKHHDPNPQWNKGYIFQNFFSAILLYIHINDPDYRK